MTSVSASPSGSATGHVSGNTYSLSSCTPSMKRSSGGATESGK